MAANDDVKAGAIMGALVGDAAGAPLESRPRKPSKTRLDAAMCMRGGGVLGTKPGQVTDDGELVAALFWELRRDTSAACFPVDAVADAYRQWLDSDPIDCGTTCRRAFSSAGPGAASMRRAAVAGVPVPHGGSPPLTPQELWRGVRGVTPSQANGALMRVSPVAVWAADRPVSVAVSAALQDAALSHTSAECADCSAMYVAALHHLLRRPGDSTGALRAAADAARDYGSGTGDAAGWLELQRTDCLKNVGHVKHAFVLAMRCLRDRPTYADAIRHALAQGGDTDTNAAVVGALAGALWGLQGIPEAMLRPVLDFRGRPARYLPCHVYKELTAVAQNP